MLIRRPLPAAIDRATRPALRPYQLDVKRGVYEAWARGDRNVLAVLPTGGGKTVVLSDILFENHGAACAVAHRRELVSQISIALARNGVRHRIIGPHAAVKQIVNLHMLELGHSYYDPNSKVAVAGVDTLVKRKKELASWTPTVTLWVMDEAHHVLRANKWGAAVEMFPNAKGLGPTATPCRADGKGLGRHADGVFDVIVEGPTMRDLIDDGYLTDYRVYAPPPALMMANEDVSKATGEFRRDAVVQKFRQNKSRVMGDVVDQYLKHANGKLGITFVPDVEDAIDTAATFTARGVPAAVVTAETPDADRIAILRRFKNGEIKQLVNVDLFGEGFDLPAIEVVSMIRPTQSYALYAQQFGRALRLMLASHYGRVWDTYTAEQRRAVIATSDKPTAIIIDHVGNVHRHGLPDAARVWSLDRREKTSRGQPEDVIPTKSCPACTRVYERFFPSCPYCHHKPEPASRSGPEFVDGDLAELDAETLAQMRGLLIRKTPAEYRVELAASNVPLIGQMGHVKRYAEELKSVEALKDAIAWWGGWQRSQGRTDSESFRRFYLRYGVDVLTAQAQDRKQVEALTAKINDELGEIRSHA